MFYDKYAKLCYDCGTSPTEAALKMKMSGSAPTKWAQGAEPHRSTVVKIAAFFGVDPSYFDDKEESPPALNEAESERSEAIRIIQNLPPEEFEEAKLHLQWLAARARNRANRMD